MATVFLDVVAASTNLGLLPEGRPQLLDGLRQTPLWASALCNARSIAAEAGSYAGYRFDGGFRIFTTNGGAAVGDNSGRVNARLGRGPPDTSAPLAPPTSTISEAFEKSEPAATNSATSSLVATIARLKRFAYSGSRPSSSQRLAL